jgi:hypothetical protein
MHGWFVEHSSRDAVLTADAFQILDALLVCLVFFNIEVTLDLSVLLVFQLLQDKVYLMILVLWDVVPFVPGSKHISHLWYGQLCHFVLLLMDIVNNFTAQGTLVVAHDVGNSKTFKLFFGVTWFKFL